MTQAIAKISLAKSTIVEKIKRPNSRSLKANMNDAIRQAKDHPDAGLSRLEATPEIVVGQGGDFSPGKFALDLRATEGSQVADYTAAISETWQRGVDAFMEIARLCAEASARLSTGQKSKLVTSLPFGEATFSKFVKIGADTRLKGPEIQRLLPPHYTTMYAVTLLTDHELSRAIADKVIHPDMKREQLQKWRNSHREQRAPNRKDPASESAVASPPISLTQNAGGIGVSPLELSQHETQDKPAVEYGRAPGPLSPEEASQRLPDVTQGAQIKEVAGPSTSPPNEGEIPAFLDRRPLSLEDQRVFDGIMAAWASHVQPLVDGASAVVCERVIAALRAKISAY